MQNYNNLNDFQMDILREIGNIGAGNAATALSEFLCDRVLLSTPELHLINVNDITDLLGGPENESVGILVNMTDDLKGMLLFILDKKFTHLIINVLLNQNIESFDNIDDMGMSCLMEIGNILSGSYVNAISAMTGLNIGLSTPHIAIDMVGAILSYPAAVFGEMGDKLLFIEENFIGEMNTVKSHLLIMPELKSLDIILKSLGE